MAKITRHGNTATVTLDPLDIHPKVVGSTVAGAISILLMWVLSLCNVDVPVEGGTAITTVLSFAGGYLTPVTERLLGGGLLGGGGTPQ